MNGQVAGVIRVSVPFRSLRSQPPPQPDSGSCAALSALPSWEDSRPTRRATRSARFCHRANERRRRPRPLVDCTTSPRAAGRTVLMAQPDALAAARRSSSRTSSAKAAADAGSRSRSAPRCRSRAAAMRLVSPNPAWIAHSPPSVLEESVPSRTKRRHLHPLRMA